MSEPDTELIARVVTRDDRNAFGDLVVRHQSAVRRFLRHLTRGDSGLADDLAQETFVRAYRGLTGYRGGAPFLTWLLGIAHNLWRNAARRRNLDADWSDTLGAAEAPRIDSADLRQDLAQAMRTLSDDERLAIHLGFQQGLSHSEIATLLGWPLGTVKTHLTRGKDKLRQQLAVWNVQS